MEEAYCSFKNMNNYLTHSQFEFKVWQIAEALAHIHKNDMKWSIIFECDLKIKKKISSCISSPLLHKCHSKTAQRYSVLKRAQMCSLHALEIEV